MTFSYMIALRTNLTVNKVKINQGQHLYKFCRAWASPVAYYQESSIRNSGSVEEYFKVYTIYWHGDHLGNMKLRHCLKTTPKKDVH